LRGYVKRAAQKAAKMSKEQVLSLLDDVVEENESLYSLFESISAGLLILDDNFCLQRYNTIAESRLNFTEHLDNIVDTGFAIWEYIDDEEICEFLKCCKEKNITNSTEEFSTVTSGGSVRFISLTISPLITENKINGKVVLIRDITDKKNQDVLVHRMENMANLTNLAAGMAHDIKNPLGAISIHIQLVQKALKKARDNENILPPKKFIEDHIDIVNDEIDHLNQLVMNFLLAVRPVKACLELKNPDKLIGAVVDFFSPEFKKNGVDVKFIESGSNQRIMLDEKLFREVILNLSQNALYAIKAKFRNVKQFEEKSDFSSGIFKIENSIRENKFLITVSDNGCGMPEETVARIFEPYFTTKANGTGLGMTMVFKIVKEFSGEISVESRVNEGTRFVLTFPIPQKNAKLLGSDK